MTIGAVENVHENQLSSMSAVLIAGGVGGAFGDSFMYPLDTVKTRQQGALKTLKYNGNMLQTGWVILREEGIFRGIYGGYTPALLGSFPSTMIFFGTYETTKRLMTLKWGLPDTMSHLTAGFLGDLFSSFIYVPSEVLKTRLQLQGRFNNPHFASGYNYRGMVDAARTIARTEGFSALFYGYKATLVRDLPFSALQLAFYEKFHAWAREVEHNPMHLSLAAELGTGALAGGLAGVLTTPLDVVKTRIQTQHNSSAVPSSGSTQLPNKTLRALYHIYRTEGLARVFSGVGPRLVWTSMQSSVMLFVYQEVLKLWDTGHFVMNPLEEEL